MYSCNMWTLFVFIFLAFSDIGNGARILAPIPFAGKSHTIFFNALFHELARRGHEVTVITPFPSGVKLDNFTEISFTMNMDLNMFDEKGKVFDIELFKKFYSIIKTNCITTFNDPRIKPYIKGEKEIDLIISSLMFCDCHLGFAHVYKEAPLIQMAPFGGLALNFFQYGNPLEMAVNPDALYPLTQDMNLIHRTINFLGIVTFITLRYWFYVPKIEELVKEYFGPDIDLWHLDSTRGSLLFLNTENSIGNSRAYSPNIIPVGGMQIPKPKPLPADLKRWLDEAESGVIYFSLGSAVKGVNLPLERRKALLNVFRNMKERILWKWEDDDMPDKPANVQIRKWLPQTDLLAHPKIKAFITQGGLLSTQEAIYHGVPIIGMPVMGDQQFNMLNSVNKGFAILMDIDNITESSMGWVLNEILNNPKYRENAKRLSRLFKDQPMHPLEKAVFWTEYVLRHKGAPHLSNPSRHLTWYQRELIDVYLVLLFIIFTPIWIIIRIFKMIFRRCVKSKKD